MTRQARSGRRACASTTCARLRRCLRPEPLTADPDRTASVSGPISRRATGLTRATVSALVDDLIAGRLVVEIAPAPKAGAGPAAGRARARPPRPGRPRPRGQRRLSGRLRRRLTGAVRHREVHRERPATRAPRPGARRRGRAGRSRGAAAAEHRADLAGAALAVPGLVQGQTVRLGAEPGLAQRTAFRPAIAGAPVRVDNEANLAALGELFANPHAGRSFIYVSGEIGIGAGIVLGGECYRGARGFSGEIGHVAVQPNGRPCRCGAHGCLEQYAGQEAILRAGGLLHAGAPMPISTTRHRDRAALSVASGRGSRPGPRRRRPRRQPQGAQRARQRRHRAGHRPLRHDQPDRCRHRHPRRNLHSAGAVAAHAHRPGAGRPGPRRGLGAVAIRPRALGRGRCSGRRGGIGRPDGVGSSG